MDSIHSPILWRTFGRHLRARRHGISDRPWRGERRARMLRASDRRAARCVAGEAAVSNSIERNLRLIDDYSKKLDSVDSKTLARIGVLRSVLEQQRKMFKSGVHRVEDRIVSVSQPQATSETAITMSIPTANLLKLLEDGKASSRQLHDSAELRIFMAEFRMHEVEKSLDRAA